MNIESTPPGVPLVKTNKLAVTSLVLGILSVLLCGVGFVFAIPGLICGFLGMSRVKKSGGMEKGHGFALTGVILSGIALVMLPLMAAIAIPNFVKARAVAQKNGCLVHLKNIEVAKSTWAAENKKTSTDTATFADLCYGPHKYLSAEPKCPAGGFYSIGSVEEKPSCSIPDHRF